MLSNNRCRNSQISSTVATRRAGAANVSSISRSETENRTLTISSLLPEVIVKIARTDAHFSSSDDGRRDVRPAKSAEQAQAGFEECALACATLRFFHHAGIPSVSRSEDKCTAAGSATSGGGVVLQPVFEIVQRVFSVRLRGAAARRLCGKARETAPMIAQDAAIEANAMTGQHGASSKRRR